MYEGPCPSLPAPLPRTMLINVQHSSTSGHFLLYFKLWVSPMFSSPVPLSCSWQFKKSLIGFKTTPRCIVGDVRWHIFKACPNQKSSFRLCWVYFCSDCDSRVNVSVHFGEEHLSFEGVKSFLQRHFSLYFNFFKPIMTLYYNSDCWCVSVFHHIYRKWHFTEKRSNRCKWALWRTARRA